MRTRTVATLVLMLALGPAGCGRADADEPTVATAHSGGPKTGASPSASASTDPDAPLKFSKCMREHGLSWFPDPSDGKMSVSIPQGTDRKKFEAAQEACKQFMPDGGQAPKPSAEDIEKVRLMAKCMRENGVPNFPDPKPDGSLMIDPNKLGTGPDDPTWKKAEAACAKYIPKGEKRTEAHPGDGGPNGGTVGGGNAGQGA